jgi:hypothetical protein
MAIDLSEVGAAPSTDAAGHRTVQVGIYLPGITFKKGYRVLVRIIHEQDQFVRGIEPKAFDLSWQDGSALDRWEARIDLTANSDGNFGSEGRYLYRFQLLRGQEVVAFWFADPFGRAAGRGTLSAFDVADNPQPFNWTDQVFRVPEVDDIVVYEVHVGEFNETFDGLAAQLPYLKGLGVNVLELMPVSNVKEDVEWGYTPLGYFAPDDRYSGPGGMKRLVRACHEEGVAVILDAVYAHAHPEFPYNLVYETSGEPNPLMGRFAGEFFERPGVDYNKEFARLLLRGQPPLARGIPHRRVPLRLCAGHARWPDRQRLRQPGPSHVPPLAGPCPLPALSGRRGAQPHHTVRRTPA